MGLIFWDAFYLGPVQTKTLRAPISRGSP